MVLPLAHFAPGPRVAPRGVSTSRQLLSSRPAESLSTRRGRGPAVTRPIGSDFDDIGRHSSGGDPDRGRRSAAARAADRSCPLRELCGAPPRRTQCVGFPAHPGLSTPTTNCLVSGSDPRGRRGNRVCSRDERRRRWRPPGRRWALGRHAGNSGGRPRVSRDGGARVRLMG